MATVSVQAQLTMEQLLEAIGKLDAIGLDSVTHKALQLQAQKNAQNRFQREAELLDIIYRKKTPAFRRRFDRLNVKRRRFTLTPEDHQELLQLIDEAQAFDVCYVEALAELAQLRRMPLPELMAQLGIKTQPNG
jgi:hypothetical protein